MIARNCKEFYADFIIFTSTTKTLAFSQEIFFGSSKPLYDVENADRSEDVCNTSQSSGCISTSCASRVMKTHVERCETEKRYLALHWHCG